MDVESFKRWVNRLGIKKTRALNKILGNRMNRLVDLLQNALPQDLKKKFGYWDALSNVVWNGSCTFTLYQDVGLDINDAEKEKYYERGRTELEPVIKTWSRYGVVLEKIDFCRANKGFIEAHFELR